MRAGTGPKIDGRLENYANNASPLEKSPEIRTENRYRNRGVLWETSSLERVRKCGRVSVSGSGLVAVRCAHGVAGFAGLATCGSVWACPVCNAKIMAVRAIEIGSVVATALARGMVVGMVTLTMRHHAGQRLDDLWDALAGSWRRVAGGKVWNRRRDLGWVGTLRAVEVTHSFDNGWHVHIHCLLFLGDERWLTGDVDVMLSERRKWEANFDPLAFGMWQRWSSGLIAAGLDDPLLEAQDWHLIHGMGDLALSKYLTKSVDPGSVGLELTSSQTKGATWSKTITPWEYLNRFRATGDVALLKVWGEYERASHGRRQLTWSRGLRDMAQLGDEQTDEEIAGAEMGSKLDDIAYIPTASGWASLTRRDRVHLIPKILEVTKAGGWPALHEFLTQHGVEHLQA